ncbi:purine-cytosine permease family protein [Amycolatopsis thermophila]|uniref:NCS1 family nucleobase:cation symporter-1 n=1 Tax=Amycolatopsis thermophila TaxID=206084 RepID=A0ABU0ERJ9_9PSEU|nr:cytosine permease [Amycolatopsis thermophila]MDQ0377897.1 NCS1 family nucleobase:cation symporter-1 [Amycolatopsis thermophila]
MDRTGLTAEVFGGRMPARSGDLVLESHGIMPVPAGNRFGRPARLLTVFFAPNLTMTAVFSGTLGGALGLGFGTGLVALLLGTVIGAVPVAYLTTWGPLTGTAQLPLARLPFRRTVVLPGLVQWLNSIAWDALVGLFGGEALAQLSGMPFWVAVAIILLLQCAVGVLGYEVIHRVQAVMTAVTAVFFVVLTVKLVGGHPVVTSDSVSGADLAGAFVLFSTIALSLSISWASYASDFSRYLPRTTSRPQAFVYTLLGLTLSFGWGEAIGLAAGETLTNQTTAGISALLGGGVLGTIALVVIALTAVSSNAMNDYSGSLALQTIGVRVRRPVSAVVVTVIAFALIMWMHDGDLASKFEDVLLVIGYWIPPFVGVVALDWWSRTRRGRRFDVLEEVATPQPGWPAVVAFALGCAGVVPFMNTSVFTGPVASAAHGADLAYYVGFVVSAIVYALLRLVIVRRGVQSEQHAAHD